MVHISCITSPRDLPDMYTHALGPNGPRAWVYISGKSLGYMIQLLHVTPSHLRSKEPPGLHFVCSSASRATYEM